MSSTPEEAGPSLIEAFWADESTPYVRRLILDEAAGKHGGATHFDFDMFSVVLDFNSGIANVEDALGSEVAETANLRTFLAALSRPG